MSRSLSKSHTPSHRVERVGELIRHAVADILSRGEVRHDALDRHPLTITGVHVAGPEAGDDSRDAARRQRRWTGD
jgi:ribosome-binding factor A